MRLGAYRGHEPSAIGDESDRAACDHGLGMHAHHGARREHDPIADVDAIEVRERIESHEGPTALRARTALHDRQWRRREVGEGFDPMSAMHVSGRPSSVPALRHREAEAAMASVGDDLMALRGQADPAKRPLQPASGVVVARGGLDAMMTTEGLEVRERALPSCLTSNRLKPRLEHGSSDAGPRATAGSP